VTAGAVYYYRLLATNSPGDSSWSTEASVDLSAPGAPTGLGVTQLSPTSVRLAWTDTSSNETGFKVERKSGAGGTYAQIATPAANATTYDDTGLTAGVAYYYRVRATNVVGDSSYSNEATFGSSQQVFFIHPDHLNTPREVYDASQALRWRWDQSEPFGNNAPDENPGSLGAFEMPLRFPGQYSDKETNLNYNYFRDYDSSVGRYVQSDPIGLKGGLNTYLYGGALPLRYSDPKGLWFPHVHKMMTEEAMARAGTSCRNLTLLPLNTADVDKLKGSQLPQASHWHSMCDGSIADVVPLEVQKARYSNYLNGLKGSCDPEDLARLLHAVQDNFSPSHRGFQCWNGVSGDTVFGVIGHGLKDFFGAGGSAWKDSVNASVKAISEFTQKCNCCN
jgi:RHS repeat-associated protein